MKLEFDINGIPVLLFPTVDEIRDLRMAYLIDAKGWLLLKRNTVFGGIVRLTSTVDEKRNLAPSCRVLASRIPLDYWRTIEAFFVDVYAKYKTEAIGYLYYDQDVWSFEPPEQTVSGASCKYGGPRKGGHVVGTVHSHGSMSAFHSSTDHKDEEHFDGIHITLGNVDEPRLDYAVSVMFNGARQKLELSDIVDIPMPPPTPQAWLDLVKEQQYTPATTGVTVWSKDGWVPIEQANANRVNPVVASAAANMPKMTRSEKRKLRKMMEGL